MANPSCPEFSLSSDSLLLALLWINHQPETHSSGLTEQFHVFHTGHFHLKVRLDSFILEVH